MDQKQKQDQIRVQKRDLDDNFHRIIIALERLEMYLLSKKEELNSELKTTGIGTGRDKHDDETNPISFESLTKELRLQIMTSTIQTSFGKDDDTWNDTFQFLMEDIFKWYGGRSKDIPIDMVDLFSIPIISVIHRQINSPSEVLEITEKYVVSLTDWSRYDDSEKADAMKKTYKSILLAQDELEKRHQEELDNEGEFSYTNHIRGTVSSGIQRLMTTYLSLPDKIPALTLQRVVNKYFSKNSPLLNKHLINLYFDSKENSLEE